MRMSERGEQGRERLRRIPRLHGELGVCVPHVSEWNTCAAFYLSKPALITLANTLMSLHIKQMWFKQKKCWDYELYKC